MKIGIVTIFNVPNYGAMLQCYSLCHYLEELGHEVFLYDIPFYTSNPVIHKIKHALTNRFMHSFINKYLPRVTSDLSEKADLYMVGSDQVWNLDIVGYNYQKFMLSFAPKDSKKVAFSASFGVSEWSWLDKTDEAKHLLSKFDIITVREITGVKLLESTFGIENVKQVMDPCFLLRPTDTLLSHKEEQRNTLVSFKLVKDATWYTKLVSLNNSLGTSLYELNGRILNTFGELKGFNLRNVDVNDWIKRISSARYVITDSFHGTVFCLLLKKNFVVVPGIKKRSSRLFSLLEIVGLKNRFVPIEKAKEVLSSPIDYSSVNSRLEFLIKNTENELNAMLA